MATPAELATLVQDVQAAEAAELEEQTAQQADEGAAAALAALLGAALAAWVTAFGTLTAAGSGTKLARYLTGIRASVDRASRGLGQRAQTVLEARLEEATRLGAQHAADFLQAASGSRHDPPDVDVDPEVRDAARALRATVAEQLRLAGRLLAPRTIARDGWRGVLVGLAAARRAGPLVRQTIAWTLHRAINDGVARTAAHYGARGLWVTEPDACVRCLAYAGRLADLEGGFPGGLSMDPRSRGVSPVLPGPPLHINCRCRLVPWMPDWDTGPGSLPDLLREQAWQSIASGRGRPSESRAARRRAAQALLAQRGLSTRVRRHATATAAGRT